MTQIEKITDYMNKHKSITSAEAYEHLGIMRLPARICDMRRLGMAVVGKMETGKNRFGERVSYMRYYFPEA